MHPSCHLLGAQALRREWDEARESERAAERRKHADALATAKEEGERATQVAVERAVAEVKSARTREVQTVVDAAVRQAVEETSELCVREGKARAEAAARGAYEQGVAAGKAAIGRSAEKAMLDKAQGAALEQVRAHTARGDCDGITVG